MDFDSLNAELARIAAGYNATPQPELLGLSPDQVEALFVLSGGARTAAARVRAPDRARHRHR